jgi:hypothetical protein
MFELDKHYKQCKNNNQPFIKARKNPVDDNYVVQLDLITCDYSLTLNGQNKIKKLFEKETEFLKNHSKNSIFKGNNVDEQFAWYDGILPDRLDNFCENLFALSEKSNLYT